MFFFSVSITVAAQFTILVEDTDTIQPLASGHNSVLFEIKEKIDSHLIF